MAVEPLTPDPNEREHVLDKDCWCEPEVHNYSESADSLIGVADASTAELPIENGPCPMGEHQYSNVVLTSNPPQRICTVCGWYVVMSDPPRQYRGR